ncbi:hypothetical protein D3OALGA1CA_1250 [Olavius algarvensis associated proteobacterium Delta 3]|nr:hypothetical protein D3OALGA1CA_1250 [Olavius algarvensis associated proteobacterium Delta 3]CAB5102745.1 hypothetical protein D3OALGB2SA_1937 [Olavius algarvensis associated proteobacterium Delta 3]
MMPQTYPPSGLDQETDRASFKRRIGIVLIIIGIMGVVFVTYNILMILGFFSIGPEKLPIIGTLIKYGKLEDGMIIYGQPFKLPPAVYYIIGFFAYLFAIRIVESLTRVLLTTGANLLDHELKNLQSKLKTEINRLKRMVDKTIKKPS